MHSHPSRFQLTRLAALLLGCLAAQQASAIVTHDGDPGTLGDPASWRTAEFMRDWGLRSIGAEFAYAAGYSGAGVKIGMVDSGYFDLHPELSGARYAGVNVNGVPGAYNPAYNDRHGTHVSGTIAASRDGGTATTNFHGVAFNATLYVGNTGRTDGALFGTPQVTQTAAQTIDQAYVGNVYRGVNAQGVRIISTSWGSQPNTEQYQTLFPDAAYPGRTGLMGSWGFLASEGTWSQGALDAARSGTVMIFSAGNTGYANASARSAAAYFMPELEANWLAAAAIRQNLSISGTPVGQSINVDGSVNSPGAHLYNQCGIAKWSCLTAPGNAINGSSVSIVGGVPTAGYASLSGTSMAAPHVSGALGVVMERFSYMSNAQAVEVLKTTAVQNGTVNDALGVAVANPTAGQMTVMPDGRNGWGTVSLRNAMNGPGQFLGKFVLDTQGQTDTWSNNISDSAVKARKLEDHNEAQAWSDTKLARGWTSGLPAGASLDDQTEYRVGTAREAARNSRVYEGSLSKSGAGTLVLSGNNSFSGGTTLFGGTLVGRSATAFGTGNVTVHEGTLAGNATIAGDLLNVSGILSPGENSIGTLTVLGSFTQSPSGGLALEIGATGADLLSVAGSAVVGGQLTLTLLGDFTLDDDNSFALLSASHLLGQFASVSFAGLGSHYLGQLSYSSLGVTLEISAVPVPEPRTYALMLGGLAALALLAKRRRRQG